MLESLDLNDLCVDKPERPRWLNSLGRVFAESASVCLEQQNHKNSVTLNIGGDQECSYGLLWGKVDDVMRLYYTDEHQTPEYGAYGISALLVPKLINLTIISRSVKGGGFDFWLGAVNNQNNPNRDFQEKARLEVSGIGKGSESAIKSRVNQKLKQITPSDDTLPGYVAVVEFSSPYLHLVKKCKT